MISPDRRSRLAGQFDQIVRAALRASVAGQEPRPAVRDAILARAAADRGRPSEGAQEMQNAPRLAGYRRDAVTDTYEGWNVQEPTGGLNIRLWLLNDHLRKRLSTA